MENKENVNESNIDDDAFLKAKEKVSFQNTRNLSSNLIL